MDAQPSRQPQTSLFEDIAGNTNVQSFIERHRRFLALRQQRVANDEALEDVAINYDTIMLLMQTAVNGEYDLPPQQVEVEYLKLDQRLQIPAGLGMSWGTNIAGPVAANATIFTRYHKVKTIRYAEMRAWVDTKISTAGIRERVDGQIEAAPGDVAHIWDQALESGEQDDPMYASVVYGVVSQALQLNFDVRDMGMLMLENMRARDEDWMHVGVFTRGRLKNRLHAWTLTCLATLNVPPCKNNAAAAWVRAYGVGAGFLPAIESRCRREFTFTLRMGRPEDRRLVTDFETAYSGPLHQLAINVLAMFGLFHLAKDHTYRTNDATMDRIGTSYINALRTNVPADILLGMIADREVIVRTAPHPFGLGQTYLVALLAARHNALAEPLRIRQDVTPPPVQRLMVVLAAHTEWSSLPGGVALNQVFGEALDRVAAEIVEVKANPPAYSALYRLYGLEERRTVPATAMKAANVVLPAVYGFAEAVHIDEANRRDGIALALSLSNLARDSKVIAQTWANMWRSYLDTMDKQGIIEFAKTAMRAAIDANAMG